MTTLYMKQKLISIGEKFTITDEQGKAKYYVEGSLVKVPKTFTIYNNKKKKIGKVSKQLVSILPKFHVMVEGQGSMTIEKQISIIKSNYKIKGNGLSIKGNLLDMNFSLIKNGRKVGAISKKWISIGDSYEINIVDPSLEEVMVALVVAIDYVKASNAKNNQTENN
ncbi:LURP-one-related/scramblase family protein [Vagococcus xieshaowenii]|nr:LURP-one-related family protein [Vagococcus xieshaowenii]